MLKMHIVSQLIAVAVATTSRTKNDVDDRLWSSHIKSEDIQPRNGGARCLDLRFRSSSENPFTMWFDKR